MNCRTSNRIARHWLPCMALGMCSVANGQIRQATEAEIELMRDALMLDQVAARSQHKVLGVEATFTSPTDDRPARLDGWVTFEPYEVQDSLCMLEASFMTGLQADEEYDWSVERFAYWSWDAGGDGCDVVNRSQIPGRPVQSSEPIPSATMAFVLANSSELLTLAYDYVESEIGETEPMRDRILAYLVDSSFRIDRIEIAKSSLPELGFAYSATFRAPGRVEGPAIVFSVTQSGFVIHSIGLWTA
jgi:hypothetical protein